MRARHVVLLSNRSLLSAGVQCLLEDVENLALSIVPATDSAASAKLRQLNPEVIVLDSGDPSLDEGAITRLLGQNPQARVIVLNLNRTGIEVYRVHRVEHADLDGLLKAIGGRSLLGREHTQNPAGATGDVEGGGTMGT